MSREKACRESLPRPQGSDNNLRGEAQPWCAGSARQRQPLRQQAIAIARHHRRRHHHQQQYANGNQAFNHDPSPQQLNHQPSSPCQAPHIRSPSSTLHARDAAEPWWLRILQLRQLHGHLHEPATAPGQCVLQNQRRAQRRHVIRVSALLKLCPASGKVWRSEEGKKKNKINKEALFHLIIPHFVCFFDVYFYRYVVMYIQNLALNLFFEFVTQLQFFL